MPRIQNTSGTSVLNLEGGYGGGEGLCPSGQVFCNDACLSLGESAGNCTLLQAGLGQTRSLFVDDTNLYYTAGNNEILKMDLETEIHESLVTGLELPDGLQAVGDELYFGVSFWPSDGDVRMVKTSGGDVTVLAETFDAIFDLSVEGDRVFFVAGNSHQGPIYMASKTGGAHTEFEGTDAYHFAVAGDDIYFTQGGLFKSAIASPDTMVKVNNVKAVRHFYILGGYVYWFTSTQGADIDYSRVHLETEALEILASLGQGEWYAHNGTTTFYQIYEEDDVEGTGFYSLPIEGGQQEMIGNVESGETQDAVADATHLYVAVGYKETGGILRFEL